MNQATMHFGRYTIDMCKTRFHTINNAWIAMLAIICVIGCSTQQKIDDPLLTLRKTNVSQRKHLAAMQMLDSQPDNEDYLKALERMMSYPGYTVAMRTLAFNRLEAIDVVGLKRTIRQKFPRLQAPMWKEELLNLIVDRGWTDLTPAIVSAWGSHLGFVKDTERLEYLALVRMHGKENVVDVIFNVLLESNRPGQQGLRGRCWDLLHRLGHRDRLVDLLADANIGENDAMLIDLRAGASDLGLVPRNREEILWMRKLREPQRAEFWSQAVVAVQGLPKARRIELELRDLPIVVAASIHDPWLLNATKEDLYAKVLGHIRTTKVHIDTKRFMGLPRTYSQNLYEHKSELTWGDLAAMVLAVRAVSVPEVVEHLFDYAQRDHDDDSCEYGGIIALDNKGRFEILEFPPRIRHHDNEFIASQEMMDAGYTAVSHFHNHAQEYRNTRNSGPGLGDVNYADNTRTNCLVFSFINKNTLNVDYYRHSRVIVDLGEVKRH